MNEELPTSGDVEKIMPIEQRATSEIREDLFNKLSEEQKEILKNAKLSLTETIYPDEGSAKEIEGEVMVDGRKRTVRIVSSPLGDSAYVDGERFNNDEATALFKFYYPIAEIISEDQHYPTEKSNALYKEKLLAKLLGK